MYRSSFVIIQTALVLAAFITFLPTPRVYASPTQDLSFMVDKAAVTLPGAVTFAIGAYTSNTWQPASLTIIDQTADVQRVYITGASQLPVTDFPLGAPYGIHTFALTDGVTTKTLNVTILQSFGGVATTVNAVSDNPSPHINGTFTVTATLDAFGQPWQLMSGNQSLYVRALDIPGDPIIANLPFPKNYFAVFPYTNNIPVTLPWWHGIGQADFEIGFSGDGSLIPSNDTLSLFVTANDFTITLNPNATEYDRSSLDTTTPANISIVVGGLSVAPNQLQYRLVLVNTNGNYTLGQTVDLVTRNSYQIVGVPHQADLGMSIIFAELLFSGQILASGGTSVLLYDTVKLSVSSNATRIQAGEIIHYDLYTTLNDRPNIVLDANITVSNSSGLLGTGLTIAGAWGYNYQTTTDSPAGGHDLSWAVTPINVNATEVRAMQAVTSVFLTEKTAFYQVNFPTQVYRGIQQAFSVQLLANSLPLFGSAGYFTVHRLDDLSLVGSYYANASASVSLVVSNNQPKGSLTIRMTYDGSTVYESATKDLLTTVFSRPYFINVAINASSVVVGETLRISGKLVEENDAQTAVFAGNVEVWLSDGVTSWLDGNATTTSLGSFTYNKAITPELAIGQHFLQLKFAGKPASYYGPSSNQPIISFSHNNQLSLILPTSVVIGETLAVHATGNVLGRYQLQWLNTSLPQWIPVANVTMNVYGEYATNLSLFSVRGINTFRIVNMNDTNSFIIEQTTVYVNPRIDIAVPAVPIAGTPVTIKLDSSEPFIAELHAYRLTPLGTVWQGQQSLDYTFEYPGNYSIKLTLFGDYLTTKEVTLSFIVFEDYAIAVHAPDQVTEGVQLTVVVQVSGKTLGTLEGVTVQIADNKSHLVLAEGLTLADGNVSLVTTVGTDASGLSVHIPAQRIGSYQIVERYQQLVKKVVRQVTLLLKPEGYSFTKGATNRFWTQAMYISSSSPATAVPVTLILTKDGVIVWSSQTVSTDAGVVQAVLPDLAPASYQLSLRVNSSDYSPLVMTTTIFITPVPTGTDSTFTWIGILAGLGVAIVAPMQVLKIVKKH